MSGKERMDNLTSKSRDCGNDIDAWVLGTQQSNVGRMPSTSIRYSLRKEVAMYFA